MADQHPFYKYNALWTRELQNLVRVDTFTDCDPSQSLILTTALGDLDRALCLARRPAGTQSLELGLVPDHRRSGQVLGKCVYSVRRLCKAVELTDLFRPAASSCQLEGARCVPPHDRGVPSGVDFRGRGAGE